MKRTYLHTVKDTKPYRFNIKIGEKIVKLGNANGDVGKTSLTVDLAIAHAMVGAPTALRAPLVLFDVLLVPFRPRSYDVLALNDSAARAMACGLSSTPQALGYLSSEK